VNRTPLARSRCGKRRFRDLLAANLALAKIARHGDAREKDVVRAYECGRCGGAHLTSQRKPRVAGRYRDTGPSRAVRKLVLARDGYACVCCGRDVWWGLYSLQHRRARAAGGSRRRDTNSPANLITLCGHATTPDGCHAWAESDPGWASAFGYRVAQYKDPASVQVRWHGEWVLLARDGAVEHLSSKEAS
jgi:hypothetical protein